VKKKEVTTENQGYTCPNPSCGRVFSHPVKTENRCSRNAETYEACPFCLTEIVVEKKSATFEEERDLETTEPREEQTPVLMEEKEPAGPSERSQRCLHQFGYLSKRSPKEKIPEECMMCENIVQCMLKNVTA
jgi:hypothetical protein